MCKKSFVILLAVLVGVVIPSINNSAGAYSTTVRYSSPGSSYYELVVPMVMAPGETATVSAVGTWDSDSALEVTADEMVTLICEEDSDEMDLAIFFDGIFEFGNEGEETNVSEAISVESIDSNVIGTWEGTFNYNVSLVDNAVSRTDHSGTIPEGGIYYVSATKNETALGDYSQATAIYEAGDNFPDVINNGDVYVFGDYEYRYQCGYEGNWLNDYVSLNWGVTVRDRTKTSYENMLFSINGKPVDNLVGAFYECSALEKSPQLPPDGKSLVLTFWRCTNLTEAPVIPNGVNSLLCTFYSCSSLKRAPVIPAAVEDLEDSFNGCTSMSGTIEINSTYLMSYHNALKNTQITEVTGTVSDELKANILATK